ncbi:MAG: nickel pincer cofactor biosynthesis protein LarB [Lachnospiraceae bacterium]|nr:nickel pincer cofactor biosynthesis protein LarB [Lachnospiraceae bacterium]
MNAQEVLQKVKDGSMSIEEAEQYFVRAPFEEMDFAKLDLHRQVRTGFPEVVFCERKPLEMLKAIYQRLYEENGEVFGTRAGEEQAAAVREVIPEISYNPVSRILKCVPERKGIGCVAVASAGTADLPAAEEAAETAEYFGASVIRIYDIGVSGIHRVLSRLDDLRAANCVVAAAGMEGALISVLGGLVNVPLIALPTSVGYGASLGGVSALLTMINSCANGISVVNIDNGYGAGYNAALINRLAVRGAEHSRQTD